MEIMSVNAAKAIDQETINEIGVPSIVLMENAAQGIFENIVHKGSKFIVFCGVGNNGGDGLAIARKLYLFGRKVKVCIIGDLSRCSGEFSINYNILINMMVDVELINEETISSIGEKIVEFDIVIDAIMGIGLNRDITGKVYELIKAINNSRKYVIAVDTPSGLDCNTGKAKGISVIVNETFTIEVMKKGFFNRGAQDYLGDISVVNIGVTKKIKDKYSEGVRILDEKEYKSIIPIRNKYGHKGTYGKVLVLAGSEGMTGAAYITTESVIRTGAGLTTLLLDPGIQEVLESKLIEAMTVNYNEKEKINKLLKEVDVIVCGPGLGTNTKSKEMLELCINNSNSNIVIDADALNIISEKTYLLEKLKGRAIFTPHPGEMSRLINKKISDIESNRIDECKKYSKDNEIVTVLKGYNTVISNGDEVIINNSGNSKMASGGMGDCLTGIIGGFLAQGLNIFDSAKIGTYIHGRIGDIVGEENYIVNARDIINEIPKKIQDILRN